MPQVKVITKIYSGRRTEYGTQVRVNEMSLAPCLDLVNHSPTGFEWGYGGSGAAQLAFAILFDFFNKDADRAFAYYQAFKFTFISRLKKDEWQINAEDIQAYFELQQGS